MSYLRERHIRRYNVVFYGVGEAEGDWPTVEEKREWDAKSCQNIFDALDQGFGSGSVLDPYSLGLQTLDPDPYSILPDIFFKKSNFLTKNQILN